MDEKILNELENLEVEDVEMMLREIDTVSLNDEVDPLVHKRIKESVLQKTGFYKTKKKLIPNKKRFIMGATLLAFVQVLFLLLGGFVGWMDSFLMGKGIHLSFYGVAPLMLYFISLSSLLLIGDLFMDGLDRKSFGFLDLLPKNSTWMRYFVLSFFSISTKILLFVAVISILGVPAAVLLIPMFAGLDFLMIYVKRLILSKNTNKSWKPSPFKPNIQLYFLEVGKYLGVLMVLLLAYLLYYGGQFDHRFAILNSFFVLILLNAVLSLFTLIRKRICADGDEEAEPDQSIQPVNSRWSFVKGRAIFATQMCVVLLFGTIMGVPYIVTASFNPIEPRLEGFQNREEVMRFFDQDRSRIWNSKSYEGSPSQALFYLNKSLSQLLISGNIGAPEQVVMESALNGVWSDGVAKMPVSELEGVKSGDVGNGHSVTNVQVQNVDEADVIKTNGQYTYYISKQKLYVIQHDADATMQMVFQKNFADENLHPTELFFYKDYLAVILSDGDHGYGLTTVVQTFNMKDPKNVVLERTIKLPFSYLTSRLIDQHFYLIAKQDPKLFMSGRSVPKYQDSSMGNNETEIVSDHIYKMKGNSDENADGMFVLASFPIDDQTKKPEVNAYIGRSGENVYVSKDHIYIAQTTMNQDSKEMVGDFYGCYTTPYRYLGFDYSYGTDLYRIEIKDGSFGAYKSAFVDGKVHNQFAMDENDGYFRLTTESMKHGESSSNVVVLDEDLKQIGLLGGLAKTEHIYASRFMGDRLYLVTFRQVDPLFVIDLKDPVKPKVLGELKIPGFSQYIHPLDEKHIIGFGMDATDEGRLKGMKMAIFDVSDVAKPKEKFVELVGDRGTYSELLTNHKALMVMKSLDLMAFPVTVVGNPFLEGQNFQDQSVHFQGAYVYNINSTEGFKLRGKITHVGKGEPSYYHDNQAINRILYIEDKLYTFSGNKVKSTDYETMRDDGEILLD
jgi:inhibitor of cysteine peptidase